MKIRHLFPALLLSATTLIPSCERQGAKLAREISVDPKFTEIVQDSLSRTISDQDKIIEFRKLLKSYQQPDTANYIIINKQNCTATVFNADGDSLETFEVALGRHIGDKRGGGYKSDSIPLRAYTTAGEYTICKEGTSNASDIKLYGDRVLMLDGDHTIEASKGKQILALHRVPATPMGKLRENVFNNKSKKDNRVSFGCVNFLVEAYDKMRKLITGKNTKVYILPEEAGNSLHLEKVGQGKYKFFQTKYRHEHLE